MKLPPDSGQIGRGTVQTLCERRRPSDSALEEAGKKEPYKKIPIRFCTIHRYISQNFFLSITVKNCRRKGKWMRKRRDRRVMRRLRDPLIRSIHGRPQDTRERSVYGWQEIQRVFQNITVDKGVPS